MARNAAPNLAGMAHAAPDPVSQVLLSMQRQKLQSQVLLMVEREEALRAELQAAKDDARYSSAALAEALQRLQCRHQEDAAKNRKSGWFG